MAASMFRGGNFAVVATPPAESLLFAEEVEFARDGGLADKNFQLESRKSPTSPIDWSEPPAPVQRKDTLPRSPVPQLVIAPKQSDLKNQPKAAAAAVKNVSAVVDAATTSHPVQPTAAQPVVAAPMSEATAKQQQAVQVPQRGSPPPQMPVLRVLDEQITTKMLPGAAARVVHDSNSRSSTPRSPQFPVFYSTSPQPTRQTISSLRLRASMLPQDSGHRAVTPTSSVLHSHTATGSLNATYFVTFSCWCRRPDGDIPYCRHADTAMRVRRMSLTLQRAIESEVAAWAELVKAHESQWTKVLQSRYRKSSMHKAEKGGAMPPIDAGFQGRKGIIRAPPPPPKPGSKRIRPPPQ